MPAAGIFDQILDPANRADPYPLYTELRKTPVTRQADGTCVVSTYNEIVALLHDPRAPIRTAIPGSPTPSPQPKRPAAGDGHLSYPRRPPRGPAALSRVGRRDHPGR
jgi:hypothetical protein